MIWATSKNEVKEDLIQATEIGWQECARRAREDIEFKSKLIKSYDDDARLLVSENTRLRELLKRTTKYLDWNFSQHNALPGIVAPCDCQMCKDIKDARGVLEGKE